MFIIILCTVIGVILLALFMVLIQTLANISIQAATEFGVPIEEDKDDAPASAIKVARIHKSTRFPIDVCNEIEYRIE